MAEPFISKPVSRVRPGMRPPKEVQVSELPTLQKVPFKRLKMRHRRIIALHLQGLSHQEIATAIGCSYATISNTLNNPLVKPILERCYADYEQEFAALTPLALRVLREEMDQTEDSTARLKAVDLTFKRQGAYAKDDAAQVSAEDVIERILEIHGTDGSKVRLSERRFLKGEGQTDPIDEGSLGGSDVIDV